MSLYDLLPPNASTLERDFVRASSSLVRTAAPVPIIRTAKRRNIPASVLPWLVYEYGLGGVSQYFDDLNDLLIDGVAWQRIRGTPAAVTTALGWMDLVASVDESEGGSFRWSDFQVGLDMVPSQFEAESVIYLARLSAPARSPLSRVFSGYDMRRFVLDDSLLSDGGLLSDHSGVRPTWADGVQISFGRFFGGEVLGDAAVYRSRTTARSGSAELGDRFILDHTILGGTDDELAWHHVDGFFSRTTDRTVRVDPVELAEWDGGPWGPESWAGDGAFTVQGDYSQST